MVYSTCTGYHYWQLCTCTGHTLHIIYYTVFELHYSTTNVHVLVIEGTCCTCMMDVFVLPCQKLYRLRLH